MKIVLELPKWAIERHIRIMAGIEMLAYKLAGEDNLRIKTARCSWCGDCCRNLGERWEFGVTENGDCRHLEADGDKFQCGLRVRRPFHCSAGTQEKGKYPKCTVEYKWQPIIQD